MAASHRPWNHFSLDLPVRPMPMFQTRDSIACDSIVGEFRRASRKEGIEPFAASHGDVYRFHAGEAMLPAEIEDWVGAEKTREALAPKF